ncbi:MAG: non-homologous end-joining DNA ligase [Bacteroidota bacterium]|nr:non-homologous end-joining DNA ligase [Bacteroidota bacterium]
MAKDSQIVNVGKRKLELSNLKKILFPDDDIVKAQVIEYYLKIAPTILNHIKGRPLSLVRFPDGIYGEKFFQKNRPDWAPDWIEYVALGSEDTKDYILANEEATLVWLANLACLEIHQMHSKKPHYDKPDYMVFDLDPPEGYNFEDVVEIALNLKTHLENFGYHVFAKTTGGKGIHVVTPIEQKYDFHTVFETAQTIAQPFVDQHSNLTLHIKKDARKGRVLVDIYRIRQGQTIVSPYSLRGNKGAPVSMPLVWEKLEELKDPREYNLTNAPEIVNTEGDVWEGISAYAVGLHTERKSKSTKKILKPSKKYKTPEQLEKYTTKRDFEKTTEPSAKIIEGKGNQFVVHRHHASRLHYDLRLEKDGVLKSWAVPKGLPPAPGVKRLAVQTEDHPMEYLKFEGTIPKGLYGGGDMWVYASGRYEITKDKKDGFYFRLHSPAMSGEYRIHNIKNKDWLMERVDRPQVDWLHEPVEPMLAQSRKNVPVSADFVYEVKWDGIRVIVSLDEDKITLRSRNNLDLTAKFPELTIVEKSFRGTCGVFDGEIVCLDEKGKPDFKEVIHRMQRSAEGDIQRAMKKSPSYCYLFDLLYLDGRAVVNEPLMRRREWLKDAVKKDSSYRLSEIVEDGEALFAAAGELGLEGVIAKEKNSKYTPGKRSDCWYKIKVRNTAESYLIGWTKGKGNRDQLFGALHLADIVDRKYEYRGKVGTGFDVKNMKEVYSELKKIKEIKKPIKEKVLDETNTIWIESKLVCEIEYSSMTKDGAYREAVFVRLRPDL